MVPHGDHHKSVDFYKPEEKAVEQISDSSKSNAAFIESTVTMAFGKYTSFEYESALLLAKPVITSMTLSFPHLFFSLFITKIFSATPRRRDNSVARCSPSRCSHGDERFERFGSWFSLLFSIRVQRNPGWRFF